MGSPKALLRYREESFLDRLVGLFTPHCSPVIVVLGAHEEAIRVGARRPATFVVNRDWPLGQTSSLQCGLAAVGPEAQGVLFTLVDHPAVSAGTIRQLLEPAFGDGLAPLVCVPRYRSRRGHPIWISRELIPELLAVREPRTAKDVVHAHCAETRFLDLDDPGIVANIDDPAAYRALTGAAL